MNETFAKTVTDMIGISGPALAFLIVFGLAAVLSVAFLYSKRRRR